jgi:hypothetical protein
MKNRNEIKKKLTAFLNSNSMENDGNIPDWIISDFLLKCLDALNDAVKRRDEWNGVK